MASSSFAFNGLFALLRNTIIAAILLLLMYVIRQSRAGVEVSIYEGVETSLIMAVFLSEWFRLTSSLWNPVSPKAFIQISRASSGYIIAKIVNVIIIFCILILAVIFLNWLQDYDLPGVPDSWDTTVIIVIAVAFGIGGKTGSKGDDSNDPPKPPPGN